MKYKGDGKKYIEGLFYRGDIVEIHMVFPRFYCPQSQLR